MASIDVIQKYGKKLKKPELREWVHPRDGDDFYYSLTPKDRTVDEMTDDAIKMNKTIATRTRYFTIAYDGLEYDPEEFKRKFKGKLNKVI